MMRGPVVMARTGVPIMRHSAVAMRDDVVVMMMVDGGLCRPGRQ
jgi:hypothetical protein